MARASREARFDGPLAQSDRFRHEARDCFCRGGTERRSGVNEEDSEHYQGSREETCQRRVVSSGREASRRSSDAIRAGASSTVRCDDDRLGHPIPSPDEHSGEHGERRDVASVREHRSSNAESAHQYTNTDPPTPSRRDQARAIPVHPTDLATAADSVVVEASTAAVAVLREVGSSCSKLKGSLQTQSARSPFLF